MKILPEEDIILLTGRKRFASQQSALTAMGIPHRVRPNGSVVVIDVDLPITYQEKDNESVNLDLGAA